MLSMAQVGNKPAAASVGAVAAVTAVEIAMLANTGDPFEFDDAEMAWQNDVLPGARAAKDHMLQAYQTDVKGDWIGNAGNQFDAYVNTILKEASEALIKLIEKLAEVCNTIQVAVAAVDGAVLLFTIASTVYLNALFAAYLATGGLAGPGLGAAFFVYLAGLATAIGAVATLFGVFQTQAQALNTLTNDLATKVWSDVAKREGSRLAPELTIAPVDSWKHSPMITR